jgi:hypothetical protein
MAKRQQHGAVTEAEARLEQVAADLGTFFGSVTGRVELWVGERDKLVQQLRQIQTTAGNLLGRLTGAAATARRLTRRRGPRRQLVTQSPERPVEAGRKRKRRRFSAATIEKMRAAQRARWARIRKAAK